jgi:hypothetical protein
MIIVRVVWDMGEPLQPASRQVGRLLTVSMLRKGCQIRDSIKASIVTNQSVLLRRYCQVNPPSGSSQSNQPRQLIDTKRASRQFGNRQCQCVMSISEAGTPARSRLYFANSSGCALSADSRCLSSVSRRAFSATSAPAAEIRSRKSRRRKFSSARRRLWFRSSGRLGPS